MKLIYVHHAERNKSSKLKCGKVEINFDDITERGKEESRLLSDILKDEKITTIISSPYLRCMHTANIINKNHNLKIVEEQRFNEIQKDENWKDFLDRNIEAIKDIVENYSNDDTIICVTSGVNISAFICYAYNIPTSNSTPWSQAVNCSPIIFYIEKNK